MFTRIYDISKVAQHQYTSRDTGLTFKDYTGTTCAIFSNNSFFGYQFFNVERFMQLIKTAKGSTGVVFGNGSVAPTKDDYFLSGELLTTISATFTQNVTFDENGYEISTVYNITNTGSNPITVGEVGLFANTNIASNVSSYFLVERTVLDNPVTIPAGGVGQVTYTIRFNYPIA